MNSFNFLTGPVADALGWTLLHAVWQGFALVLPAAVALHLLRNQSSALRYRIGTLTLFSQLLVSAATFVWYYKPSIVTTASGSMTITVQALPIRWQAAQTLPWQQHVQLFMENHLGQFVFMYLVGVALFGLRLAGGWLYLQRLTKMATEPAASVCLQLTNRIRSTLAIQHIVQVRESARIVVPMVVGVLKPVLLLPMGLVTKLTTRELEAVLAHELAHIKRHDYGVNLLQSLVEVFYFFHPALWWLSARVREEREHCCDDLAVQACGGNGRILAQALARVEELRLTPSRSMPTLAIALTTNRPQLLHRVQRILGVPTRPFISNGSLAGLTLATVLLMSVSVYAIQEHGQPKPTKRPSSMRRYKSGGDTVFNITDGRQINSIVWRGKKLPASHIARLQNELNQVMAGQLSLDDVKQSDRDILLELIETINSPDESTSALTLTDDKAIADAMQEVKNIDYKSIVADALQETKGIAYDTLINRAIMEVSDSVKVNGKWVKATTYRQSMDGSALDVADTSRLQTTQRQLELLTRKMQEIFAERQPVVDRLSKEMTVLAKKTVVLQKSADPFRQQQTALAKQQTALARQQNALAQKLIPLQNEIARLSTQHTPQADQLRKQKTLQTDRLEKQMDALGIQMGQLGSKMGNLGMEMAPTMAKLEPFQQRIGILADSISKLYEPTYEISAKIGELSNQLAQDANEQAEKAMRLVEEVLSSDSSESNKNVPARRTLPRQHVIEKKVVVPVPPVPQPATAPLPPAPAAPAPRVHSRIPENPPAIPKPASAPIPKQPQLPN